MVAFVWSHTHYYYLCWEGIIMRSVIGYWGRFSKSVVSDGRYGTGYVVGQTASWA